MRKFLLLPMHSENNTSTDKAVVQLLDKEKSRAPSHGRGKRKKEQEKERRQFGDVDAQKSASARCEELHSSIKEGGNISVTGSVDPLSKC